MIDFGYPNTREEPLLPSSFVVSCKAVTFGQRFWRGLCVTGIVMVVLDPDLFMVVAQFLDPTLERKALPVAWLGETKLQQNLAF